METTLLLGLNWDSGKYNGNYYTSSPADSETLRTRTIFIHPELHPQSVEKLYVLPGFRTVIRSICVWVCGGPLTQLHMLLSHCIGTPKKGPADFLKVPCLCMIYDSCFSFCFYFNPFCLDQAVWPSFTPEHAVLVWVTCHM